MKTYKLGLILPSTNVTFERELGMFLKCEQMEQLGVKVEFLIERVPMSKVTREGIAEMNKHVFDAAGRLARREADLAINCCLIGAMFATDQQTLDFYNDPANPGFELGYFNATDIVLDYIHRMGKGQFKRIAAFMPYSDELTRVTKKWFEANGFELVICKNYGITNNEKVAKMNEHHLAARVFNACQAKRNQIDLVIASVCVQMPSVAALNMLRYDLRFQIRSSSSVMLIANWLLASFVNHSMNGETKPSFVFDRAAVV